MRRRPTTAKSTCGASAWSRTSPSRAGSPSTLPPKPSCATRSSRPGPFFCPPLTHHAHPLAHPNTRGRALRVDRFDKLSSQWRALPAPARDFISKLLVVNPAERMTAEAALLHPWLVRGGDAEQARRPSAAMPEAPGRRTSTTTSAPAPGAGSRRTSTAVPEASGAKESSSRRASTQDVAARKGGPAELERRASTTAAAVAAQPTQSAPTSARPSRSGTPTTLPAAKPSSS